MCPNSLYKKYGLCWTSAFLLGVWQFSMRWAEDANMTSPPVKSLGPKFLISFPGRQHFMCVVTTCCWRHQACLRHSTGRGLLENCPWFPLEFAPGVVYCSWLSFVSFTVINHSCEYNCLLSNRSPPCESLVWGTPDTTPKPSCCCFQKWKGFFFFFLTFDNQQM